MWRLMRWILLLEFRASLQSALKFYVHLKEFGQRSEFYVQIKTPRAIVGNDLIFFENKFSGLCRTGIWR